MPLTAAGKKTKQAFIKEYGPEKGKQIFYAYENKHKKKISFKRMSRPKLGKFSKARLKSFNVSIRRSV